MRVYIWHGYLLSGTGSNEYTRALARTLAHQGNDVVVFSQDPDPSAFDLGGAATVRPEVPGRLPVFVLDRYPDLEAVLLGAMPGSEVQAFVAAQAAAIRAAGPADLLITNHVLLGGPVGAASGLPFVVKAHGSELEYAMRGNPDLCRWAGETLESARAVIVGSGHIAGVMSELVGLARDRMLVVPPGVDTQEMAPQGRDAALAGLLAEAALDGPNEGNERLPDGDLAARLASFLSPGKLAGGARAVPLGVPTTTPPGRPATSPPTVVYVGKLSAEKGVHLLLDALVGVPARAVIVGFGPARQDLERQAAHNGLEVLFTGPLAHRHLRHLWAFADVSVVPSVFPEAFGMVAAEAAATGCPPLVARHSGLAEVAAGIEEYLPQWLRILSFPTGDVTELRSHLVRLLELDPMDREAIATGSRAAVQQLWSWDSVATRMLHAGSASAALSRPVSHPA